MRQLDCKARIPGRLCIAKSEERRATGFSGRGGVLVNVRNGIFLLDLIPQKILRTSRPTAMASRLWPPYLSTAE